MTTLKPLPCPVCGREPRVHHKLFDSRVTTECAELTILGDHIITARADTEAEAVERWNRMVSK